MTYWPWQLPPAPAEELSPATVLALQLRLNASAIESAITVLSSGRAEKAKAILMEALTQSRIALGDDNG